jgi:muramoyltetrapeptide carboxypeptidase
MVPRGARIAVVAPGSPVDGEAVARGTARLRAWGYEVVPGHSLHARTGDLAGADADRAADVTSAFEQDGVAAVWCARGGWGSARLLERLDLRRMAGSGRPMIGFSDITALLLGLWRHGGTGWHAPLVADLARPDRFEEEDLRQMLSAPQRERVFVPGPRYGVVPGRARGPLVGGCLSVLAALAGTPHQPDLSGAIVFLEEVGEAPYRVDRMLWQLRASGMLRGVAGLAFGQLTGCVPPPGRPSRELEAILAEHAEEAACPALSALPFGHGAKARAVPFGVTAELDADEGVLRVSSGA